MLTAMVTQLLAPALASACCPKFLNIGGMTQKCLPARKAPLLVVGRYETGVENN